MSENLDCVKNPYAAKVLNKIPILRKQICTKPEGGIVIKESLEKNFYNAKILLYISKDYSGKCPCCFFLPLNEEKIIFYVYPNFVKEINPKDTLFFSIDNPKPEILKVDLAVYQYIHCDCKKYSTIESFEILNTSCVNLAEHELSILGVHDKLNELNGIYAESAGSTIVRSFFGIFLDTKGIVPLAVINDKYVLFKTIGNVFPVRTDYHAEIITRPELESREMTCLYDVIDDKDLRSYYLATIDAYILTGLKFVTELLQRRIPVKDEECEQECRVVVGKFGDVLLVGENKTYVFATKSPEETVGLLDAIYKSKSVVIKDSTITLTNDRCYYVGDYELR